MNTLLTSNGSTPKTCLSISPALEEIPPRNCSFEKLLIEAIDETFLSIGDSAKQAIYFHLEKTFNISKQKIPHELEAFTKAIEKIFGLGAKLLEIQIMKRLYKKIGYASEYFPAQNELVFTEYVTAAKLSHQEAQKLFK